MTASPKHRQPSKEWKYPGSGEGPHRKVSAPVPLSGERLGGRYTAEGYGTAPHLPTSSASSPRQSRYHSSALSPPHPHHYPPGDPLADLWTMGDGSHHASSQSPPSTSQRSHRPRAPVSPSHPSPQHHQALPHHHPDPHLHPQIQMQMQMQMPAAGSVRPPLHTRSSTDNFHRTRIEEYIADQRRHLQTRSGGNSPAHSRSPSPGAALPFIRPLPAMVPPRTESPLRAPSPGGPYVDPRDLDPSHSLGHHPGYPSHLPVTYPLGAEDDRPGRIPRKRSSPHIGQGSRRPMQAWKDPSASPNPPSTQSPAHDTLLARLNATSRAADPYGPGSTRRVEEEPRMVGRRQSIIRPVTPPAFEAGGPMAEPMAEPMQTGGEEPHPGDTSMEWMHPPTSTPHRGHDHSRDATAYLTGNGGSSGLDKLIETLNLQLDQFRLVSAETSEGGREERRKSTGRTRSRPSTPGGRRGAGSTDGSNPGRSTPQRTYTPTPTPPTGEVGGTTPLPALRKQPSIPFPPPPLDDPPSCAACGERLPEEELRVLAARGGAKNAKDICCRTCSGRMRDSQMILALQMAEQVVCACCTTPIVDRCVRALGRDWLPEHFLCAGCGQEFAQGLFVERHGKAYCPEDYFRMFGPKCRGCRRRIRRDCVHAMNHRWHPDCFGCEDCKKPFEDGVFYELDRKAYCERHYHQRQGTLCQECLEPVVGECVTALERKFHPGHFVCFLCRKSLLECAFGEKDGKPCCGDCL